MAFVHRTHVLQLEGCLVALIILVYLVVAESVDASSSPFTQVGPPLITGEPRARFGDGVAVSKNGQIAAVLASNKAYVSMLQYNSSQWVFLARLTPYDLPRHHAASAARSVSISHDGTYVAFGSDVDYYHESTGSAWVFNRTSDTNWEQMGSMIRPSTAEVDDHWAASLSLANDGRTLALGSPERNSLYVFTLNNYGVWTESPDPLHSTDGSNPSNQGISCALNEDGTLLAFGG